MSADTPETLTRHHRDELQMSMSHKSHTQKRHVRTIVSFL